MKAIHHRCNNCGRNIGFHGHTCPPLLDLTGHRYGRLMVTGRAEGKIRRSIAWECVCDCGEKKTTSSNMLRTGHAKSCGCLNLEAQKETHTKHGMAHTRTWGAWKDMKARCSNPRLLNYQHYGGRGITVCDQWLESFENFLADMGPRPEGLTLDRINNDGNYEPGNCRWATWAVQAANKRPRKKAA